MLPGLEISNDFVDCFRDASAYGRRGRRKGGLKFEIYWLQIKRLIFDERKEIMKGKKFVSQIMVAIVTLAILISNISSISFAGSGASSNSPVLCQFCNAITIVAEPWLKISDNPDFLLEGPAFDREGNLFVTEVWSGKVLKITPDKKIQTIYDSNKSLMLASCDIHKDGRLFLCSLTGKIISMNSDGSGVTDIVTNYKGKALMAPDDLIFTHNGCFYFNDFGGSAIDPIGRVYHVSADFKKVTLLVDHVGGPNGISLAPGERRLWIGEHSRNALLEINLAKDKIHIIPWWGTFYAYYFHGDFGPDSNYVDSLGNVYQCLYEQGEVAIFNKHATPIAEVLIPGRDVGKHLKTTNLTFRPGTDQAFVTSSGKGGAYIWTFKGLGKGMKLFSHQ